MCVRLSCLRGADGEVWRVAHQRGPRSLARRPSWQSEVRLSERRFWRAGQERGRRRLLRRWRGRRSNLLDVMRRRRFLQYRHTAVTGGYVVDPVRAGAAADSSGWVVLSADGGSLKGCGFLGGFVGRGRCGSLECAGSAWERGWGKVSLRDFLGDRFQADDRALGMPEGFEALDGILTFEARQYWPSGGLDYCAPTQSACRGTPSALGKAASLSLSVPQKVFLLTGAGVTGRLGRSFGSGKSVITRLSLLPFKGIPGASPVDSTSSDVLGWPIPLPANSFLSTWILPRLC